MSYTVFSLRDGQWKSVRVWVLLGLGFLIVRDSSTGEARSFFSLSPESVSYAPVRSQMVPSPLSLLAPSLTWGPIFTVSKK